jgi:hypothetical protein
MMAIVYRRFREPIASSSGTVGAANSSTPLAMT